MNNVPPTDKGQEDVQHNIEELLEGMRPPGFPDQAIEFAPAALKPIAGWKKYHAVAIVAGLLTEVKYQVNAVRLDWLQRLILSKANGKFKPKRADIEIILNSAFGEARVTRLEDPIEDLFCEVVPTSHGDRLVFTGHWEHAAACTDTLIQAFETLPEAPIKQSTLESVDTLLKLNDELVKRARLARHDHKINVPWENIILPSAERLKKISRRVSFSDAQLQKLGISRAALVPFLLQPKHFSFISSNLPGNSPLEFYPLIETPNGILVVHPGTISLAARAVLLQTAKQGGLESSLMISLATIQENYSEWSGFWSSHKLHFMRRKNHGLRRSVCQFAPGRYQHVIQIPLSLDDFPQSAFGGITPLSDKITNAIKEDIEHFWAFLKSEDDYIEAITVLFFGGWGKGCALSLKLEETEAPSGWRFLHISFAEASQLGACENGKLRHLWRIVQQVDLLERLGYVVQNRNGTMNLFGNWQETQSQFIPEHMVDIDPPCNMMLPIDSLFKPRLEAAQNLDLRALPFPGGSFKRVQRIEWRQYGNLKPIYGSLTDIEAQRLIGAIAVAGQIWWIEAIQDKSNPVSFDWQYQMWNAVMQWLAEVAPQIILDFPKQLPKTASYVRLVVANDASEDMDIDFRDIDPSQFLEGSIDIDGIATVSVRQEWIEILRSPRNDAEVALITAVLERILVESKTPPFLKKITASIRRSIPSPDWRWLHSGEVTSFLEKIAASGLVNKFREIPLSASALVKCGSIWRFRNRADGYEFTGEEQCRDFLESYYDFVLKELVAHIKTFNRNQLIVASAQRYQAARGEQHTWRTSIRALREIHGKGADKIALERQSAMNAVQRAAKVICEIAACESPENGGSMVGQDDLDEMYARALLLFGNGQIYASIRAGIVDPHLKISPAGDLLSDRSVFAKTLTPSTIRLNTKTLNNSANDYVSRNIQQEKEPQGRLALTDSLRLAIEKEYLCPAEAFADLQFVLLQLTEERKEDVFTIHRSELLFLLAKNNAYPKCDASAFLDRLTLVRRDSWLTKTEWLTPRDLDLWRFDRRNSLINRPLLALTNGSDPIIMIAPIMVSDAAMYALSGLYDGTLHNDFWSSHEARKYAGARADELGTVFEDSIVKLLKNEGLTVSARRQVTSLLQQATEDDMGDVDVFAISTDRNIVWVIEAKNLRLCRTETEIAARMTEYRGKMRKDRRGRDKPDKMLRHLNRVRYLRQHAELLGRNIGLNGVPIIHGLMVVNAPQPMNFHMLEEIDDAKSCMLDDLIETIN